MGGHNGRVKGGYNGNGGYNGPKAGDTMVGGHNGRGGIQWFTTNVTRDKKAVEHTAVEFSQKYLGATTAAVRQRSHISEFNRVERWRRFHQLQTNK